MDPKQLLDNYSAPEARVSVCLRSDLITEIERLEESLPALQQADAGQNRTPEAPVVAARVLELKAEAEEAKVEFIFRSIGRRRWSDLIRSHAPTNEQKAIAEAEELRIAFNPDTLPPEAMHLSCVQPEGLSLEWWQRTWDQWGEGQVTLLWNACQSAHYGVSQVPKARRASAMMSDSAQSSDSQSATDSPAP